jgi:DNA-binding MarR family transcriptional regulator
MSNSSRRAAARPPTVQVARSSSGARHPELDYRALAEIRYQIRRFTVFSEQQARAAGLEPQQHQLLLALKGLPPGLRPSIGVLAERLAVKHHTVVGLVDRLVGTGLVRRSPSDVDHREILIVITARGRAVLRGLSLRHEAELRTAGPALVDALQRVLATPHARTVRRRPQE